MTYIYVANKMSNMQPSSISYQPLLIKHKAFSPIRARFFWGVSLVLTVFFFLYLGAAYVGLPAFLLNLGLMFVLVLLAGLILFGRRSVIVDEAQGQVTAVHSWHLFQRAARYQLKDVITITVTECVKSDNRRTTISYPIHLLLDNGTAVHLQTAATREAAYQLARPLANRWQVPLEEQYYIAP